MANHQGNKSNILSYEKKLEMVKEHFENNVPLKDLVNMYNVSYSAARNACINYQTKGPESLRNKTGRTFGWKRAKDTPFSDEN
ncbi:helix-turn-helix domain-containing protein [Spiroplasma endosymbiont of Panorpa germanica]|uniref:helix-turn-helix domain-containing protein n=1 Tax=Spiroplasma endosymbiont of Panorpa germanica TaxID=3066314 RepID=UPI0030CAB6AB